MGTHSPLPDIGPVHAVREEADWKLSAAQYEKFIMYSFFPAKRKALDHLYTILYYVSDQTQVPSSAFTTPDSHHSFPEELFSDLQRFARKTFPGEGFLRDESSSILSTLL